MSSDMMIICQEDDSGYDGNSGLAFFVDECSMGDPLTEFGGWFQDRFCGAPGLFEQLAGVKSHNYTEIKESDLVAIQDGIEKMKCHEDLDKIKLIEYIHSHLGKHISTENW